MSESAQPFRIPAGAKTPAVLFDYAEGIIDIKGVSLPENGQRFYQELIERVSLFKLSDKKELRVSIDLNYFNSQSSKSLFLLFREIRKLKDKRKKLVLQWHYDGEDEEVEEFVGVVNSQLDLHLELVRK